MSQTVKLGRAAPWLVDKGLRQASDLSSSPCKVGGREPTPQSCLLTSTHVPEHACPPRPKHAHHRLIKCYLKCDALELLFLILWASFPAITCDFLKLKRKQEERRGRGQGIKIFFVFVLHIFFFKLWVICVIPDIPRAMH